MKTQFRFLCFCLAMLCAGIASAAPLTGTLTVPSTAYPTLKSAIDSLNFYGVSGAVTVSVTSGNAQTAPTGGYRLGSATLNATLSSSNTLAIAGNGNTVNAYVGTGSTDGMFYLMGTDYVTINGLTLAESSANTTTTTSMEWGFVLCKLNSTAPFDGAQANVINGCTIAFNNAAASSSTAFMVLHSVAGSSTILTTNGAVSSDANSNNLITGNTVTGVARGVYQYGISLAIPDKSNRIGGTTSASGNSFSLGGSSTTVYGIATQYDSTLTVTNNTMVLASGQSSTVYYVFPQYGKGDLTINNNYFNLNCSLTSTFFVFYNNSTSGHNDQSTTTLYSTHSFTGNTVTGTNSASSPGSIYVYYDYFAYCLNKRFVKNIYNNINWGTSTSTFYGMYCYYSYAPNINVDSNQITNYVKTGSGGASYALYVYDYPAVGGTFSAQGNVERNIQCGYYWYGHYYYGSGTSNPNGPMQRLLVRNNIVDSVDYSAATSTQYLYGIYAFYGGDSSDVSSNRITNINFSSAVTSTEYMYNYFGYAYYGQNKYTVRKNVINNIKGNYLYANNYVGYDYATQIDSNTISNITMGTGGSANGYIYNYLGYFYINGPISNNTIYKMTALGSSQNIYNYVGYYYGTPQVSNNVIKNVANNGSGAIYNYIGYYNSSGAVFDRNRVDSIYTLSAGTNFYPWYSYLYDAALTYSNNIVTNIITGNTSAALYPMYMYCYYYSNPATVKMYNNIVSNITLPSGYNTSNGAGIYLYPAYIAATPTIQMYNNTVSINPGLTTGGAAYGFTGLLYPNNINLDLRNNIINVNVVPGSSGYTAALRRTSGTASTAPSNFLGTSNANIYYAPNNNGTTITNSWLYGEGTSTSLVNTYNLSNDASFNTPCGLFKTFVGHDNASATENNLTAGTTAGTYVPAGTSYAESGSFPTPYPIAIDFNGAARGAVADIGAIEFSGTALDAAPPAISYNTLPTQTYCITPLTLTATITDNSGVRIAPGNGPRLYYKKSTENNSFGANTSATNGWKYVEFSTKSGSNYTFNFDYTLLNSTLTTGDSITYFVVAMDSSANSYTGAFVGGFASCLTSVSLSSTNGGSLSNVPAANGFKILVTPTFTLGGVPSASCGPGAQNITLLPNTLGAGIQWQSATFTGTFANISGATSQTYSTGSQTATMRYRAVITCPSATTSLATTAIDTFIIAYPAVLTTTGATRCGYGALTLNATAATSSTPRWYTTATGGVPLTTGTTYTTPPIASTQTYYVGAVTPNAGTEIATKTPASYGSTYGGQYGIAFTTRNPTTNYYSTTVFPSGAGTLTFELWRASDFTNSSYTYQRISAISALSSWTAQYPPVVVTTTGGSGVSNPLTVPLNWMNLPAGQYVIVTSYSNYSGSPSLNYEYNVPFPYYSPSGNVSLDGGAGYGSITSYSIYYWHFYNNVFSGECETSTRTPVVATITPAPAITFTSSKNPGMCIGDTAVLKVVSTDCNYSYTYSPPTALSRFSGSGCIDSIFAYPTATTTYRIIANDYLTGCANTDTVKINVNVKPGPPAITPVSPIICQKGQVNLVSTKPAGLGGVATIGTGTLSNGAYGYPTPYGGYWGGSHDQYLITVAELQAAGVVPGNITSLAFNLQAAYSGNTFPNFTIKMAHSTLTNLSTTLVCSGLNTVYGPSTYTLPSTTGWATVTFTTPFLWNGTQNIVVDVSYLNCTTCNTTSSCTTTYNSTGAGSVYQSTTSYISSVSYYTDNNCSIPSCTPSGSYNSGTYSQRPNMRFGYQTPANINWLNVSGLYKNTTLATSLSLTDTNGSVFASPVTTTVYRTVANVQGCLSNPSNPDTVFVNPAPVTTITPAGTNYICQRDSITFTVASSASTTYQWYYNGGIITGATSNIIRVGAAGRYRVLAQNATTGCTDTNGVDVIINPRPVSTVAAGGPTTFCNGDSVLLSAAVSSTSPAAATWQWYNNGAIVPGATAASYKARITGNYNVYAITALGCGDSSTNTINVNVNTTPANVTANGPTTFCTGGSVTLQASTGSTFTYQWYNTAGAISGATSSAYVANTTNNYYVKVTNTVTGCTSTSVVTAILVGTPPPSTITPSGAQALCTGSSLTLTTNTQVGLTYQWYRNSTAISAAAGGNSSSISFIGSPTTGGSYTVNVSVTGTPACNSTTALPTVVTVNPLPTPTTSAAPSNKTICQNDSVTLTSNTATGLSYQWNRNGGTIQGAQSSIYAAKAAGVYTITQTINSTGCSATSNPGDTVTVNPLPNVVVTPASSTTFCQGGSVVLNASPTTGTSFVWYVNNSAITPAATNSSYTASQTGSYSVIATYNSTGCKSLSTPTSVQINPKPNVTTTPTDTANACQGGTTTISVPTGLSLSYQWRNATNTIVATTASYTTGTAGTYRAYVSNTVTGCFDTSRPVTVVINQLPTAVATLIGPAVICQNDSTKMKVTTDFGTTFQWYNNTTLITSGKDSVYYAKRAGAHYAIVTSAKGCSKTSNSITITVNPVPPAYITYNTPLEFCSGSAVVLNANAGANLTYQWLYQASSSVPLAPNGNTGTYNITNLTGMYALKTTNQFGCSTVSDTLAILVHAAPVPTVSQSGSTLQTSQPYTTYQWFYNNDAIGGATAGTYNFSQNGAYKVRVVDQFGCEGTSDQFFINNVGIINTTAGAGIHVYPNPTSSILHIDASMKVKAVLRDVTGKTVIEAVNAKELNLGDIAAGMYLLYISDLDGQLLKAEKVTKTAN